MKTILSLGSAVAFLSGCSKADKVTAVTYDACVADADKTTPETSSTLCVLQPTGCPNDGHIKYVQVKSAKEPTSHCLVVSEL